MRVVDFADCHEIAYFAVLKLGLSILGKITFFLPGKLIDLTVGKGSV